MSAIYGNIYTHIHVNVNSIDVKIIHKSCNDQQPVWSVSERASQTEASRSPVAGNPPGCPRALAADVKRGQK